MLSSKEAETLAAARELLRRESAIATHLAKPTEAYVAGYAEAADEAMFAYLNRAAAYLRDSNADTAIKSGRVNV